MAGIGFKLQKLLHEGTYFGVLKGFFFASFLVAGPWIVTVIAISLLNHLTFLKGSEYDILRTSIVYLYAFSLVLAGLYQMPLTRFLADELYLEKIESIIPSLLGMGIIVVFSHGVLAGLFSLFLPLSLFYRLTFLAGFMVVSLLWLSGIYLGCLRDYEAISYMYCLGSVIILLTAIWAERRWGMDGAFFGFVFGQALILLGLVYRIFRELAVLGMKPSFACLEYLKKHRHLLLVGFFYNLAIWVDKFIFWFSPSGQTACRGLYSFGMYDTAMFLAYVTIIPALGMYLMTIETLFYEAYRDFYGAIMKQLPLKSIINTREEIVRVLKYTFFEMLKVQGAITILVFYFAPELLEKIHYPQELLVPLRYGLFGAFFQALFLFVIQTLLYFDYAEDALEGALVFFAGNFLITLWTLVGGHETLYGLGYLLSTSAAFLVGVLFLRRRLKELICHTFMGQPIPNEVTAEEPLMGPDRRLGEIIMVRGERASGKP